MSLSANRLEPETRSIEPGELPKKLKQPGLRIVDARPQTDYAKGHIPGAVADFMATVFKAVGIDPNKQIVARNARPFRLVDKGAKVVEQLF